jgi:ribose-phosphate pyrophosphokinase
MRPIKPMLLFFDDEQASAERLALAANLDLARIECHRFPDGELKIRLPPTLPKQVLVLRSLHQPNEKLIELLLTCQAARPLGAQHLMLVAPYLAYMRQDMVFLAGEAISQQIMGRFLAQLVDALITVDPHLHRVKSLAQAVPVAHALAISAAPLLSDEIAARRVQPLLIGPDEESRQWVSQAAARHHFEFDVCQKLRLGDHSVQITVPPRPIKGRHVVLVDDVASTGQTLSQAARLLFAAGAESVAVAVTHALFANDAVQKIREAGVQDIWSTDSIPHASNAVSLATSLAEAIALIYEKL